MQPLHLVHCHHAFQVLERGLRIPQPNQLGDGELPSGHLGRPRAPRAMRRADRHLPPEADHVPRQGQGRRHARQLAGDEHAGREDALELRVHIRHGVAVGRGHPRDQQVQEQDRDGEDREQDDEARNDVDRGLVCDARETSHEQGLGAAPLYARPQELRPPDRVDEQRLRAVPRLPDVLARRVVEQRAQAAEEADGEEEEEVDVLLDVGDDAQHQHHQGADVRLDDHPLEQIPKEA
mmetsp:Transcript_63278/g.177023  ORF Transcript_63278/g.177023 Transcript_63278/m.177023 type:complete len:236 (+) Transcript_63278:303-1010(+)